MTQARGIDLVAHFRTAYDAVVRFPLVIAPPIAVGVLGFVLFFVIGGGTAMMGALVGGLIGGGEGVAAGGIVGFFLGGALFVVVMGLLWMLSSAVVVVMGRDALGGREPALGDALGAVIGRLGAIAGATILVTAIVGFGLIFLVLPGLLAAVLLAFTLPAILLDGRGVLDGMGRSVAIVRANPGPILGLVVGAIVVLAGVAVSAWIVGLVPVLGHLAAFVLQSAAVSYLTVTSVRFYQVLGAA
jgi:hypothetical protein